MATNNDALIEIAIKLMKDKVKPQTIISLAKEVFEIKGIKFNEKSDEYAQFQIDFMLCGNFIVCGEDKKGDKLWDLKDRQPHDLQDKEGYYSEDHSSEAEEAEENELKDEIYDKEESSDNISSLADDDEDEDQEEKDEIEEELELDDADLVSSDTYDPEEDVEEDDYDDHDD